MTRQVVIEAGIRTQALSRTVQAGALERVAHGRYRLPDGPTPEHLGLALVAAGVPKAVVCLLAALSYHRIGTQLPHKFWLAIDRRSRRPALAYPKLRVLRFSGPALSAGV